MFVAEIVLAFIIGVVFAFLLGVVFRWQRPGARGYWSSLLFLFALLFLTSWIGGVWVSPAGPIVWGIYWVPFVFTGAVVALLLWILVPTRRPRNPDEAEEQAEIEVGAEGVINVAFWILIVALIIGIIAHYATA